MSFENRFWGKVDKSGDCWLWRGQINKFGYGQFGINSSKTVRAHRLAYELRVGPIPDGLTLDHLCSVRSCVNPKHLEAVTMRENLSRSAKTMFSINSAKTMCGRGHGLSGDNLYTFKRRNGTIGRNCRECKRLLDRKVYWRSRGVTSV